MFETDASFLALRLEFYFFAAGATNPDCADRTATKRARVRRDVSPTTILVGPARAVQLDTEST